MPHYKGQFKRLFQNVFYVKMYFFSHHNRYFLLNTHSLLKKINNKPSNSILHKYLFVIFAEKLFKHKNIN